MLHLLKRAILGTDKSAVREAREQEIRIVKSEITNSIQAIQSGNRILATMSGMIALQRSKTP